MLTNMPWHFGSHLLKCHIFMVYLILFALYIRISSCCRTARGVVPRAVSSLAGEAWGWVAQCRRAFRPDPFGSPMTRGGACDIASYGTGFPAKSSGLKALLHGRCGFVPIFVQNPPPASSQAFSSGVLTRANARLRCGNRPKRRMTSRCASAYFR